MIICFRCWSAIFWLNMSFKPTDSLCRTKEIFSLSELDPSSCGWQLRSFSNSDVKLPVANKVQSRITRDHIHSCGPIRKQGCLQLHSPRFRYQIVSSTSKLLKTSKACKGEKKGSSFKIHARSLLASDQRLLLLIWKHLRYVFQLSTARRSV